MANDKRVSITTGIGTLCFPKVFPDTAGKKDDGTPSYEVQILIPKSDKASVRALLSAIKDVGEEKWGTKWKSVRTPLRDGDREKDELTEDGTTKEEKYPERLGHYFLNARSTRPVSVVNRRLEPITNSDEVYPGCTGRISVTFYPYGKAGNFGIGVGLNGVQKVSDGDQLGGSAKPAVESMFDLLDEIDEDEIDEIEEIEDEPAKPARRATAKKAAAKKAAAKKPVEVDEDEDDLYDDLDDLDD